MLIMELKIPHMAELLSISGASFILIFLAEFGDKSQLVCMTLAAKHRPWPVLLGAVTAFGVLNLLAVLFGTIVSTWIPEFWLALAVAGLFGFFGFQSLLFEDVEEDGAGMRVRSSHGLFVTALLMIFVAEFGDKTQLAVAGLASTYQGLPVWLGSTVALIATTVLGVVAGQRLLKHLPLGLVHKFSGVLFLLLATLALYQTFS
ncbi:MAG: putative Ca2+/H+ antiporter (TMEM165/GDT1 family) [Porticoccus sp.]|jgi:putative Ca2+/H+ antiporter (TMEM165/GDT1 family)